MGTLASDTHNCHTVTHVNIWFVSPNLLWQVRDNFCSHNWKQHTGVREWECTKCTKCTMYTISVTFYCDKHIIETLFLQSRPKAAHRSSGMGVYKVQGWGHRHQGDHFCPRENIFNFLIQTRLHQVHMKVHSTEKAFSCPECGTGFRHKNSLVRHRCSCHIKILSWQLMICPPGGNTRSLDPKNVRCAVASLSLRVAWRVTWELRTPRFGLISSQTTWKDGWAVSISPEIVQTMLIRLKKEAQQWEQQEQCFFIMEVLQVLNILVWNSWRCFRR